MLNRRSLIPLLASAFACPMCLGPARAQSHTGTSHWSYEGEDGPTHWSALSSDYGVCSLGIEQSPIDLRDAKITRIGPFAMHYATTSGRVLNNGHTIQVNCAPGTHTEILGTSYELVQFHFHHPSEHLLAGKQFDLECHFVHRSPAGGLAVVGVLIKPGVENAALQSVWQAMPTTEGPERPIAAPLNVAGLLPKERTYFRYSGSLTTPPCAEGVLWTVFKSPISASAEQIRRFAALFPGNARPVLPVNRRFLLESA